MAAVFHEETRIHELWEHTKNELKNKARELAELERARAMEAELMHSEHTHGMREMQAIAIELRDKNRALEQQLQSSRAEGRRLGEQLQEAQRKAREASIHAEQHAASGAQLEQRAREMQESLRAAHRERKELVDKSYADFRRQEEALGQREIALGQVEIRLRAAQQDAHAAREEAAVELERARTHAAQFDDADQASRELSRQLSVAKESLKYLQHARRNESQLHVIVEQLQHDNARLVKILAATDEFRGFVEYAHDSSGLSYIAPSASAGIGATLRADARRRDLRAVRGAAPEADGWVPSDAFTLANEFRHAHAPGADAEAFADLLLRLNHVWRQREQRHVARLKERFRDERARLVRRGKQSLPYELVVQESEIERLKKELRAVRLTAGAGRRRLNETEERLFEKSLSAVESLSAQLASYKDKEDMMRTEGSDSYIGGGAKYADGAASASRKAAEIVLVLSDKVGLLVRDFQQKTVEVPRDDADVFLKLVRVQGWFLECLERRINSARDRIENLAHELMAEVAEDDEFYEARRSGSQGTFSPRQAGNTDL